MDVDTATSIAQAPAKHALPELEIYSYLLVLIFLIDNKRYEEVQYLLRTPKYSFTHNSHFYYFFLRRRAVLLRASQGSKP